MQKCLSPTSGPAHPIVYMCFTLSPSLSSAPQSIMVLAGRGGTQAGVTLLPPNFPRVGGSGAPGKVKLSLVRTSGKKLPAQPQDSHFLSPSFLSPFPGLRLNILGQATLEGGEVVERASWKQGAQRRQRKGDGEVK